ncbi:hypothetical protein EYF80_005584 [Liparis tanakae]|uniref:Secreted protein n=1 Tax=Liparis tanakae TaxID=230148 RepID=A0A4Z2J2M4_9TELE|nr:hypothetical protein EYF80_005584 [Liparis tanakae]
MSCILIGGAAVMLGTMLVAVQPAAVLEHRARCTSSDRSGRCCLLMTFRRSTATGAVFNVNT